MHLTGRDFMAVDDHKLPLTRNVGDAFAVICRVLGGHQPNAVAKAMGMDRKTARNALDGKAGVGAQGAVPNKADQPDRFAVQWEDSFIHPTDTRPARLE